jgi:V/A-type H+-transporting ATPase subunit K
MGILILAIAVGLVPMIPAVIYFLRQRRKAPASATQSLIRGLKGFNVVFGLMVGGLILVWLAVPSVVKAAGILPQETVSDPYASIAAALATGLATIGAGFAVSNTGSAAIGAIAEKPETFGRALIFVGLAEGIAIYGLIISFLLLNR